MRRRNFLKGLFSIPVIGAGIPKNSSRETIDSVREDPRAKSARDEVLEEVETRLKRKGIKNPGQYRNAAVAYADELCDLGKEKQPRDKNSAIRLLTQCYFHVSR
jgi:hypothetical protein